MCFLKKRLFLEVVTKITRLQRITVRVCVCVLERQSTQEENKTQ